MGGLDYWWASLCELYGGELERTCCALTGRISRVYRFNEFYKQKLLNWDCLQIIGDIYGYV